jgi:hypothetical protein
LATSQVTHTTSSATGQFSFNDVAPDPQLVTIDNVWSAAGLQGKRFGR